MKPRLCLCRTCREPLPLGSFRRHNDEMRTRHDSCAECENKAKALKALKRPKATVRKDRYNAARYAARVGKAVGPVEVKTVWVGVNARLTGPKRPEQEYANGTN